MGSKLALVLCSLLLVAGVAIAWMVAGGRSDGSRRQTAAPPTAPARADAAARPAPALEDGGGLVGAGARAADRELVAEAAPRASAPEPAAAVGPRLHGRVVDPQGRPIAGAAIVATDREGLLLDVELPDGSPLASRRARAETDADGRYALAGLQSGNLGLSVRKAGFAPHVEERIPVPAVDAFELPDVVLHPGAILEGRVVDPYGIGVAGAKLFVEENAGGFRFGFFFLDGSETPAAVTASDGSFRVDELALGAWHIRVESESHPERAFEGICERAGEVVTRTFELEAGRELTGRVTGVPEADQGRLIVRATPAESGDFFGAGAPGAREADVGADGSFALAGLRAGAEYVLQARERQPAFRFGGFTTRTRSERVRAAAGARGVLIPYQPEAAVHLQVVDARTGAPIEAFEVRYGFRWLEPLRGEGPTPLALHPEGRARIGNLRPDESPARLDLQIDAVGYRRLEREDVLVLAGQETDLGELRLEPLPLVVVKVVDQTTGEPVAGALVRLEEEQEDDDGFPGGRAMRFELTVDENGEPSQLGEPGLAALTDEEGIARLNSKPGRRCALTVTRDGYAPGRVDGLYLPPDEQVEQTVALGAGGEALVRVVDEAGAPVVGVRVDHRAPDEPESFFPFQGGRRESITDAEGSVRFAHLLPGEHRFRIHRDARSGRGGGFVFVAGGDDGEGGWTAAEIAAGAVEEVVLVQGARGALRGRVTEAGAPLVGATVRVQPSREDGMRFAGFGGPPGERTGSDGAYRVLDLEPGAYRLTVEHPKRRMPMSYEIEIEAGENRFDADLSISIVEGRIVDQDQKPLAGVEVAARRASGEGGPSRAVMFRAVSAGGDGAEGGVVSIDEGLGDSVVTDADGRYSLRGVAPDVDLVVRASGDGVQAGESEPFQVAPDQTRRGVDLELEAAGSIVVEVTGADGKPADFVFVRATFVGERPEDAGPGADPKFTAVQNGKARLSGLRPGRWSVAPNPFGAPGDDDVPQPDPKEVVVEAGRDAHVAFQMP